MDKHSIKPDLIEKESKNEKKNTDQERLESGSIRFHESISYEKEIKPIKKTDKIKE